MKDCPECDAPLVITTTACIEWRYEKTILRLLQIPTAECPECKRSWQLAPSKGVEAQFEELIALAKEQPETPLLEAPFRPPDALVM